MAEATVTFDDAAAYERYMGRWSRAVGEKFLAWLDPPRDATWLDLGCGTGAFTELILKSCAPSKVTGVDPAPAQIEHAKKHITAPNVKFQPANAVHLPFRNGEFDIVASALVIHFIPDRAKGFREMLRVAKPGGIVAGYTWERSAASTAAPYGPMASGIESIGAEVLHSPLVPEAMPDGLRASLEAVGFSDIDVTTIEASEGYLDFEDFWTAQTPSFSPGGRSVAALSEADRERLRATMRTMLPAGPDGSIRYAVRATSFKARKPQ